MTGSQTIGGTGVPTSGGSFGRWCTQSAGLPGFAVTRSWIPATAGWAADRYVWHQVGNDRILATAAADGHVCVYTNDCGTVNLTPGQRANARLHWTLSGPGGEILIDSRSGVGTAAVIPTWLVGGARWSAAVRQSRYSRTVWAPFGDLNVLIIEVVVDGTTGSGEPARHVMADTWCFAPYPIVLGGLMSRREPLPPDMSGKQRVGWEAAFSAAQTSRTGTDWLRRRLTARLRLRPQPLTNGGTLLEPEHPRSVPTTGSLLAWLAEPVFVVPLTPETTVETRSGQGRVEVRASVTGSTLRYAIGFGSQQQADTVADLLADAEYADTARLWSQVWRLSLRAMPPEQLAAGPAAGPIRVSESAGEAVAEAVEEAVAELERETAWHAGMLRSSSAFDAVLGHRYTPQGSAYGMIHGLQGAPRDYAIFSVPLTFVDPAGARELILLMAGLVEADGTLAYAHTGAGRRTGAGIHSAPTDLPIAFAWAVSEYVFATGDRSVLDELVTTTRQGRKPAWPATVRDRLLRCWDQLHDTIGLGPHGLVRVGSGDWNDPISAMATSRRAFHRDGESMYNTAQAAYVLPRLAALLEDSEPAAAASMRSHAQRLRTASAAAWDGKWFLRGWDGQEQPLGRDHLFLDANAWCLIAELGTVDQRAELARSIDVKLCQPSPIGPTCLDRPINVRGGILAPGWDTNGGVWAALCGLAAWGLAGVDNDLAWRVLRSQTMASHARAYPDVWYGIWSGPDAFNAHFGSRPGETFVQPATPMREYPIMNANQPAGVLLATLRVLGINAGLEGIFVNSAVNPSRDRWELECPLVSIKSDESGSTVERR